MLFPDVFNVSYQKGVCISNYARVDTSACLAKQGAAPAGRLPAQLRWSAGVLLAGLALAALVQLLRRRWRGRGGSAGVWSRLGSARQVASPARRTQSR